MLLHRITEFTDFNFYGQQASRIFGKIIRHSIILAYNYLGTHVLVALGEMFENKKGYLYYKSISLLENDLLKYISNIFKTNKTLLNK